MSHMLMSYMLITIILISETPNKVSADEKFLKQYVGESCTSKSE